MAYGLWKGMLDFFGFVDGMVEIIYRGYEQAWREGERRVGISPQERTAEEAQKLQFAITDDISRVMPYGDFIQAHTEAKGGAYGAVVSRAELWANRYISVANLAALTAGGDQKMVWYYGATEDHCVDCAAYENHVYRASVWTKYGIRPQSRNLECEGWRCDCRLVPTMAPVSPGRPKSPSGGGF